MFSTAKMTGTLITAGVGLALVAGLWIFINSLRSEIRDLTQAGAVWEANNATLVEAVKAANATVESVKVERDKLMSAQADLNKEFRSIRENNRLLQTQISALVEELISMAPAEAQALINQQSELLNQCIEKTSRGQSDAKTVCAVARSNVERLSVE